jgi:MOSC domain-containing protein YiiM
MGRVEAIWLKRMKRGPMDPVARATLIAGRGLRGNANQGGRRQVTLISAEAWARVTADLGVALDPSLRRANLLVSGLELARSRGRVLAIGACRIRIQGETTPCYEVDEAHPGLQAALAPEWRGGVFGVVESGGEIAVGDAIADVQPGHAEHG